MKQIRRWRIELLICEVEVCERRRLGGKVRKEEYRGRSVVFSHGGLRLKNVLVQYNKGGNYVITGIIDW